jgi:polynucleotide 5'-kinase involved in rRNA processing
MNRQAIRDIVSVPEHPTVVRLDALGTQGADWIEQSYCLTDDVRNHLNALEFSFSSNKGRGIFVIGPYGSGKSHLLA